MNNQLFIPDRINVGYNQRNDTYTGKLAYVILRPKRKCREWVYREIKRGRFE